MLFPFNKGLFGFLDSSISRSSSNYGTSVDGGYKHGVYTYGTLGVNNYVPVPAHTMDNINSNASINALNIRA